jgi:hypothetical protein
MAEGDDRQLFSSRTAIQSFVMMESSNQRLEKVFDVVQTAQCEWKGTKREATADTRW